MAEQVAKILNGDEEAPEGTQTLVERYQRLMLVLMCSVPKDDAVLIDLEMDELFDTLLGALPEGVLA